MKKSFRFTFIFASLVMLCFAGCDSRYNEDIMYGTVGSSLDKEAPEAVEIIDRIASTNSITIRWKNASDKDLYGVKIVPEGDARDASGNELNVLTLMNKDPGLIPDSQTFNGLYENTSYIFTIYSFDRNYNMSVGKEIAISTQSSDLNNFSVLNPKAFSGDQTIDLTWDLMTEIQTEAGDIESFDIYGIKIAISADNDEVFDDVFLLSNEKEKIRTSYTFEKLTNDVTYSFTIFEVDKDMRKSKSNTTSGKPVKHINKLMVSDFAAVSDNASIHLSWKNPADSDFYGLKLMATSDDGDLGTLINPIYFLNDDGPIPELFTVTGLTNNSYYVFDIYTIDTDLNIAALSRQKSEIPEKKAMQRLSGVNYAIGDGCASFFWTNPVDDDFYGVKIVYTDPEDNYTQVCFLKDSMVQIPSEYTISNLENGKTYTVNIYAINTYLTESLPWNTNFTPVKNENKMNVSNLSVSSYSNSVTLGWTNPNSADFKGLKISAEPDLDGKTEAEISNIKKVTPIYYINDDASKLPSGISIYELTNEVHYKFTVQTIDKKMYLSSGNSYSATPTASDNTIDVSDFKVIVHSGKVKLTWTNPSEDDIERLSKYKITVTPAVSNESVFPVEKTGPRAIPSERTIEGLINGVNYTFTLRTVDISEKKNESVGVTVSATPNDGSGSLDQNKDFFRYKKDAYAFDFGYCTEPTTKVFTINSQTYISDLTQYTVSKYYDPDNKYTGKGSFTYDFGEKTSVSSNDDFTLTVTYTPSAYTNDTTASWDEETITIGGMEAALPITFIGSNYPQPKDIGTRNIVKNNSDNLKLWLRADMISTNNLENGAVKSMPDYSGNEYNAICSDTKYTTAPLYIQESDYLNKMPSVDFSQSGRTNAQLIALGSSGSPIVVSEKGITSFVVFYMVNAVAGQSIISSNYGTSFPTLMNQARYYNKTGFYIKDDYKYGLSVKGNGLAGSWRWACISNETDNNDNSMLMTSASTASGIPQTKTCGTKSLSVCMRFDRSISDGKVGEDFPSNIRMYVNNDERFLGYIYSLGDANYTKEKLNNSLLSSDGLTVYGSYGRPFGDGKGHRFGSMSDIAKPSDKGQQTYNLWKEAAEKDDPTRPYDRAYVYTPAASSTRTKAGTDGNGADYYENWISKDIWKNGTINTLTVGADYVSANNCYSQISEVIIFDYALSDEEIEKVNNYIKYRYNIQTISTNVDDYKVN